jgi:hypothetical protein
MMIVNVTVAVEVDPEEYNNEYGENETVGQIRTEIKNRVVDAVNWELRHFQNGWFKGADLK